MIATEDSNATITKDNNYTTNWNNWYLLNYLTLLRLLPTNEPTKRLNVPVLSINRNWHDFYATKNRDEVNRTTTGKKNISSRPIDKNEARVQSYGLKHSVTPKRIPKLLYLVLRRLCLDNESYLSLLRITSEVELLPLYNQRHYMTATWLKTNNMPLNDWETTRT